MITGSGSLRDLQTNFGSVHWRDMPVLGQQGGLGFTSLAGVAGWACSTSRRTSTCQDHLRRRPRCCLSPGVAVLAGSRAPNDSSWTLSRLVVLI